MDDYTSLYAVDYSTQAEHCQ